MDNCPNLLIFDAQGTALNQSTINIILNNLDENGLTNGILLLDGGTSASPSGTGITAKNNLVSKGWMVSTN
jgi:hypothetical protein